MPPIKNESKKKSGSYFTPKLVANFLAEWCIRKKTDTILDPAAGSGVLVTAALRRLVKLGRDLSKAANQIFAIEKNEKHIETLSKNIFNEFSISLPNLQSANFFKVSIKSRMDLTSFIEPQTLQSETIPLVNAIIANPPYIRYHHFKNKTRELALQRAKESAQVNLPALSSAWAPFLAYSTSFLEKYGRIGFVLPSELLQVDYASEIRSMLLQRFEKIYLITFESNIFQDALEEVILLLAEGQGPAKGLYHASVTNEAHLTSFTDVFQIKENRLNLVGSDKWIPLLLHESQLNAFNEALDHPNVISLGDVASIDIGVVTGANSFFLQSKKEVNKRKLDSKYLRRIISRAKHLNGKFIIDRTEFRLLCDKGEPVFLFTSDEAFDKLDDAARSYIEKGVKLKLNERFKTRIRVPWYSVPLGEIPDAFLTYMSHFCPRFVGNNVEALSTNTIHRVFFSENLKTLPLECVCLSFYNSLTLFSVELFGRSYGGGVLKLEPSEAEALKFVILSDEIIEAFDDVLKTLNRAIEIEALVNKVDKILLEEFLGLSSENIAKIRSGWAALRDRRLARSSSRSRPTNYYFSVQNPQK